MPDLEISNLTALPEANVAATDPLAIVDVSGSETKKITVKDIGRNEKGDITINGRPLLKYRLFKEMVEKFIVKYDLPSLFEGSSTGTTIGSEFASEMDDGPRYWWGNQKSYRGKTTKEA